MKTYKFFLEKILRSEGFFEAEDDKSAKLRILEESIPMSEWEQIGCTQMYLTETEEDNES